MGDGTRGAPETYGRLLFASSRPPTGAPGFLDAPPLPAPMLDLLLVREDPDRVRAAIVADHRVGGRLALWGRRLMGEALSQAQRVAAERDSLAALLAGGVDRPGMDLAALARMFSRLTENHTKRMAELGLAS